MSRDILDLIDDACSDWTVSTDAMRWQLPRQGWDRYEPVVRPPRPGVEVLMAAGWDGYAATAEVEHVRAAVRAAMWKAMGDAVAQLDRLAREFYAGLAKASQLVLSVMNRLELRLADEPTEALAHVPNGHDYTRRQRNRRKHR